MEEKENLNSQQQRYKYLAYCVVRDAIGFYFGIPKFLESNKDRVHAYTYFYNLKTRSRKHPLTEEDTRKLERWAIDTVDERIKELEEDFEHCLELLSNDNIWLQLLDLTPEGLFKYLESLSEADIKALAIVPRWTTQDHALGRPFINDDFVFLDERTDEFN